MQSSNIKIVALFVIILLSVGSLTAQKKCCSKSDKSSTTSIESEKLEDVAKAESTSGCNPSSCRGAQTKFGEAKIITTLRKQLIDLKAEMETYANVDFPERSYSVHGLVGKTDDESLGIIIDEVKIIEDNFVASLELKLSTESLPESKAKQIVFLENRISLLQAAL